MPSATSVRLMAEYGGPSEYRFAGVIQVKKASKLTDVLEPVNRYEPWTNRSAKELLNHHPIAIWSKLSVTLAPRSGIYGRMCTFYGGWAAAGQPPPRTVEDMIGLRNAVNMTYGGTGDPGTNKLTMTCEFDDTMKDLLKCPSSEDGCRPIFYYCFVEVDVVTSPGDGDRFMLAFQGEYSLHGRY